MIDSVFPKIHNEGYKFLVIFTIGTIILYFISGFLGFIGLVLTIWCYYFFRDPERVSVEDDNFLINKFRVAFDLTKRLGLTLQEIWYSIRMR